MEELESMSYRDFVAEYGGGEEEFSAYCLQYLIQQTRKRREEEQES